MNDQEEIQFTSQFTNSIKEVICALEEMHASIIGRQHVISYIFSCDTLCDYPLFIYPKKFLMLSKNSIGQHSNVKFSTPISICLLSFEVMSLEKVECIGKKHENYTFLCRIMSDTCN